MGEHERWERTRRVPADGHTREGGRYPSALDALRMVRHLGEWMERAPSLRGLSPGVTRIQLLKYRSPEEWRFRLEHLEWEDARYERQPADVVYALGVFLYHLLTRRFPFDVTEHTDSVRAVIHEAPTPPHHLNPRVPGALGELCLRLLEKTPEKRPPNLAALCTEVERLMARADERWQVPLYTPRRELPSWVRVALMLVLTMTLGGTAGWLRSRWVATRSAPSAHMPAPAVAPIEEERPVEKPLPARTPPPLLRELPSEDCPAGAAEAMKDLRIILRAYTVSISEEEATRAIPVGGDSITFTLEEPAGKLPYGTVLSGRPLYTPGRLHARLTRARTLSGEEYPVCMELREGRMRGARLDRESTPNDLRIQNLQKVWPVERFE